ncbi:amino acid adenylation domain-containing protein, partial [Rhodococcus sp. T7]|uniref:amino acid adenylation domain-containing protein n=1 Tax=Rhodococcus sp. T7 TaxID=627444 RepID=UPI003FA74C42
MSAAQRGIWFAQHALGDVPLTIAQYIELRGDIDLGLLTEASKRTGREFGSGFLRLVEIDGVPYQYVDKTLDDAITYVDLRAEHDPVDTAQKWMRSNYSAPLDLLDDRLVVVYLLHVGENHYFWFCRIHHIALDGFGAMALIARIAEIYTALVEGAEPPAPSAEDLVRIVEDEQRYRSSGRFAKDREYWAERTAHLPEAPSLAGRAAMVGRFARLSSEALPESTATLLDEALEGRNASSAPVVVAAFAAYLAHMTDRTDVVLSLPVSARTTATLRRSGGMVSNIVPLRLQITPEMTVSELVKSVQIELTGALRRQRYRHEDIRRDAGAPQEQRGFFGPSINIMMFHSEIKLGTVTGHQNVLTTGPVEDLSLNIYQGVAGSKIHIDFEANPNLYSGDELDRHHSRFFDFFERFLGAGDDASVSHLAAMSDEEREQVVSGWNGDVVAPPAGTIVDLFDAQVARTPDATALVFEGAELTYAEFDARVNRLARTLIGRGVGPEKKVALAIRRSLDSMVAMYAVVKAGGAYVPLDPDHPAERTAYVLDSARPLCILTVARDGFTFPAEYEVVEIDNLDLGGVEASWVRDEERLAELRPTNTAYVIYTSGSTGRPKGVAVSHASVLNQVTWIADCYGLDATDVVLQKTPTTFDVSVWELFSALASGSTLVIAVPDGHRDPAYLADVIAREKVSATSFVPSMLSVLVAEANRDQLVSLRVVLVAGEAFPPAVAEAFRAKSDAELHNLYGPTEFTVHATAGKVDRDSLHTVPIGTPVWNTEAYVLDGHLRPVPIGSAGELYLTGAQVARGYEGRPDLTSERFVANPFGGAGSRLYRTGDLVKWRVNGAIEYLGRTDFQVKVRGLRIELGEIEAAMSSYPHVAQSVAVVHDSSLGQRLVGYVVPESGSDVDIEDMTVHVGRAVPSYMVPDAVMVIAEMPVGASGKLDRRALPEPVFAAESTEYVAPRSAMEELLAGLFAEVLGTSRVSVGDSFFALGGDSIVAIQLVSRAKEAGVQLTARDVFERRTVASLADVATFATDSAAIHVLEELPGAGIGSMPLMPVVHWMTELGGDFHRFSQSILLTLPPQVDRERLTRTLEALVDRHDALRSILRPDKSRTGWRLEVGPIRSVDVGRLVDRVEFREGPGTGAFATLLDHAHERAVDLLDPAAGTLVRFVWFAPAEDRDAQDLPDAPAPTGRLLMVVHHLAVDGVSWRILIPDLVAAWGQIAAGADPLLPAVSTSVRRWAHGLADNARSAGRVAELDFWKGMLEGSDPLVGSRGLDTRDVVSTTSRVRLEMPGDVTDGLVTTLPRVFHGDVNDGLLTSLALAVAKWRAGHGISDASTLVHLEGRGREEYVLPGADLSRTVGWFTSMFPVRLSIPGLDLDDALAGGASAGTAIKCVKEQLASVPEHGIGYGLLRYLNRDTSSVLAGLPNPQIRFNYLGRATVGDIPERLRASGWIPDTEAMELSGTRNSEMPVHFALDINAMIVDVDGEQRLSATIDFPAGVLEQSEVEEFAGLWRRALEGVVEQASRPDAGGRTSSDFDLVALSQHRIDTLERTYPALADVWSLAPLQVGLLFHAAFASSSTDVYTTQLVMDLGGSVDADRLRRAAEALIARHPTLRTAFVFDEDGIGLQVVVESVPVPWKDVDLRSLSGAEREAELAALTLANRIDRFDIAAPPLVRFMLARIADDRYRFAVTNHHIVLDGWSLPIFVQDLLTLYAVDGDALGLPQPRPYRAYLEWLAAQDSRTSVGVWAQALAGLEESTLLAPHHTATASAPSELVVDLSDGLLAAMADRSRELGVTMNTLVQAAWGIVLGRLTGRDDVVFGATVSGRPPEVAGVETMLGLFINTLPVRVRMQPHDDARALLQRIQFEQSRLLDDHYIGLADIQQELGLGALFDTLLVFESYPLDREALTLSAAGIEGLQVLDIESFSPTHYPLAIIAMTDPQLHLIAHFLPELFTDTQVENIMARVVRVLEAVTADLSTSVADIDVLGSVERSLVLEAWNESSVVVDSAATLVSLFDAQVRRSPRATAVVVESESITYAEFDARVNRLARYLISVGVGPESTVGLAVRRSADLLVGMYAIVKAGGAYVPLDPDQPAERNTYIVETAEPVCVLATERDGVVDIAGTVYCIDTLDVSAFSGAPITDADRLAPLLPANTAYVIFTSGSTGRPKGVVVSHASVVNQVLWLTDRYEMGASDVVLQKTPVAFDVSVWEFFGTLAVGARLVIARPDGHRDPEYLARVIEDESVTMTSFVPSMLPAFASVLDTGSGTSLRAVLVAGEELPTAVVEVFASVCSAQLHNLYGPTEFAVHATARPVLGAVGAGVPIGTPVWNTRAYVLDGRLHPVPVGVAGELYLGGVQMARGYAARSDLTAERFVADPFRGGGRLYRTGDLVSWTEDGELIYHGRTDFQVKVRGLRIEVGEIEAVLSSNASVQQVVVVVHTAAVGEQLVAYVVPADDAAVDTRALGESVRRSLPSYMVPDAFVVLDALPLNASGKLDRKALPAPVFEAKVFRA